jgi:hypothetical protein
MMLIVTPPGSCTLVTDASARDTARLADDFRARIAALGPGAGTVSGGSVPTADGALQLTYLQRPAEAGAPSLQYDFHRQGATGSGIVVMQVAAKAIMVEGEAPARSVYAGRPDSRLVFDGQAFELAYEQSKSPLWSREYVRPGERIEQWTRLLTLQRHRPVTVGARQLAELMRPPNAVAQGMPEPQLVELEADRIYLLAIALPDTPRGVVEANVFKLIGLDAETVLVQADAVRVDARQPADAVAAAVNAHWQRAMRAFRDGDFDLQADDAPSVPTGAAE